MTTLTDIPRKTTKGTAFLIEESTPQDIFTPEDLTRGTSRRRSYGRSNSGPTKWNRICRPSAKRSRAQRWQCCGSRWS